MRSTHRILAAILVGSASLSAQSEKLPLRVLFIGEAGHEARTEDFVAFLATRFAVVQAVTHATVPSDVQTSADVVLLDWNQGEKTQLPPPSCPLGLRAPWKTPTVLLGSAGLFVACIWKVNGGSG
jgi:hypothetical protein